MKERIIGTIILFIILFVFTMFCAFITTVICVYIKYKKRKKRLYDIIEIMESKGYHIVGYNERVNIDPSYDIRIEKIGGFKKDDDNTFVGGELLEHMSIEEIKQIY